MDGDGKKRPSPKYWRRSVCLFPNFLSQSNTYLNTVDKTGLLMIPAKGTDGIDDLVHVSQRHPIHEAVQFMEILLNLPAAAPLQVFIASVQERQNRLTIPQFQRVGGDVLAKTAR